VLQRPVRIANYTSRLKELNWKRSWLSFLVKFMPLARRLLQQVSRLPQPDGLSAEALEELCKFRKGSFSA
jgi:hypothetical protein